MAQAIDDHEVLLPTSSTRFWDAKPEYMLSTSAGTRQPLVGQIRTPRASIHANIYGNMDDSMPRSSPPIESNLASLNHWRHYSERNIVEVQQNANHIGDTEKIHAVEQGYVAGSAPLGSSAAADDPWEASRSEIERLYMNEGLPLREVMVIMARRGFDAQKDAYKKRFQKWNCRKYKNVKDYPKPDSGSSVVQPRAGRQFRRKGPASTCTIYEEGSAQSRLRHMAGVVRSTGFVSGSPTDIRQIGHDRNVTAILFHVKKLYISSIEREKWQVKNQFVVQEDIHDDLLVGVGTALQNFDSQEGDIGGMVIRKAFVTLEKVVTNCGLFSLPTIWESYLRMIRRGRNEIARIFLNHALRIATGMAGHASCHPFVQVIDGLLKMERTDPDMLEHVILCAYRSCIDHVIEQLSLSHLTALSLWSDFVVYMDNSSAGETKQAVDSFRSLRLRSEKDNGVDDDFTLEILGLSLYVLQSTKSTAAEAELVALDMICRVNRRLQTGERLEGSLLIMWKDLKHTLGNFCYAKGELKEAIKHVEDCLGDEVADDRDMIALKSLEEWYTELDEPNEAERVRQWRISSSQLLFQEDKV